MVDYHDDYSSSTDSYTDADNEHEEELYAVSLRPGRASDLRCYKEITSYKKWFQGHLVDNPNVVCATSDVAKLCGLDLKIYFSKREELPQRGHKRKRRLPVNKIATMLSFDPNTGLYNHLVHGKAYVVVDSGSSKLSKRAIWTLQELISEHKGAYHEYGADFSREGQMKLLKACVQFKKGKWIPSSIYGMAIAKTEAMTESPVWNDQHFPEQPVQDVEMGVNESIRRSSGSHWFISAYEIIDLPQS